MKAVKETIRKYYKYQYQDFVQPVLTANGILGGDSFAVAGNTNTFNAFDGATSGSYASAPTNNTVIVYNPNPICLTNVHLNAYSYLHNVYGLQEVLCADTLDGEREIIFSVDTGEHASERDYNFPDNTRYAKYWFITYGYTGTGGYAIYEYQLTGTERTIIEATEEDYDFYEDIQIYKTLTKAYRETERKYYKYQYSNWTQPVLTSDGVLGGDSFAAFTVDGSNAFQAFDESLSTAWGGNTTPAYIGFYNPNALNVTNISIRNYVNQPYGGYYTSLEGAVYGSNNGVDWDEIQTYTNNVTAYQTYWDIPLNNTNYYKYYKISTTKVNQRTWQITDIKLTATQREVVEGIESDYDFYKDFDTYKLPREVDIKNFKTIYEQAVAGEYEITLDEGNYLVELVGAGGGYANSGWSTDTWYYNTSSGGSGAGFKGIVNLSAGNYTITVGQAGVGVNGGSNDASGGDGGDTTISNLITAGGGRGAFVGRWGANAHVGYGGTITIANTSTVIESILSTNGINGNSQTGYGSLGPVTVSGALSVYDYTTTGYGAGGGYPNEAVDGYIKIMQQTTADDSTTNEIIYTYYAIGE